MKDKKEIPKRGLRSTLPLSSSLDEEQIRKIFDELIEKCGPQPLKLTKNQ